MSTEATGPLAPRTAGVSLEPTDPELDTRDRLIRAAIEVFIEKGYGGTRVQDIARRAGYTSGAMYVHFPSRSALLGEAIILEGRRLIGDIVTRVGERADGGGTLSHTMAIDLAPERTPVDRLILEALALASRDAESKNMLSETLTNFGAMIGQEVQKAFDAGTVDPSLDADAVRDYFLVWSLGAIVLRAVGFDTVPVDAILAVADRMSGGLAPAR